MDTSVTERCRLSPFSTYQLYELFVVIRAVCLTSIKPDGEQLGKEHFFIDWITCNVYVLFNSVCMLNKVFTIDEQPPLICGL